MDMHVEIGSAILLDYGLRFPDGSVRRVYDSNKSLL
jgi:hypothetical protein